MGAPELRVRDGERLDRLRVLSTKQREDRLHEREDGIEKRVSAAKARRIHERRHRLVDRAADPVAVFVENGERLAQSLLVDLDGGTRTCRVREHEQADEPVEEVLPAPEPKRGLAERLAINPPSHPP